MHIFYFIGQILSMRESQHSIFREGSNAAKLRRGQLWQTEWRQALDMALPSKSSASSWSFAGLRGQKKSKNMVEQLDQPKSSTLQKVQVSFSMHYKHCIMVVIRHFDEFSSFDNTVNTTAMKHNEVVELIISYLKPCK